MKKLVIKTEANKEIIIKLFEEAAPMAVASIEEISKLGKYNNRRIERLEPGFVIQPLFYDGLDADIDRMIELEIDLDLSFKRYIVGMAGDGNKSSAAQFFITLNDAPRLNGKFTIVGEVVDGFAAIEEIETLDVIELKDEASGFKYHAPLKDYYIKEVTVK